LTDGGQQVALSTRSGMLVRFEEGEARSMGRDAAGVKGVNLGKGDRLVSMDVVQPGATLLTVSEKGYGKRTPTDDYRLVHRGAKGVLTMRCTDRTGSVVGVQQITDDGDQEIMIVTSGGKLIRIAASDIRVIGRNTQGVRLVHLSDKEESVVSVASVAEGEKVAELEGGVDDVDESTEQSSDESPDESEE
jgi:DNA gyrase subunit A